MSRMNRHYKDGFRTSIINDLYDVEPQLQEYDEHLYIMWNPNTGEHLVMDGLLEVAIMRIPQIGFECLDSRVVNHIKRIHTANGFSAVKELDSNRARREREQAAKVDDMAYNFAKDTRRAVRNLAYYGA